MSYETQRARIDDSAFQSQILMGSIKAAEDIAAENPATTNHTARLILTGKVLSNPEGFLKRLSYGVSANLADGGSSFTDAQVYNSLSAIWDAESLG
jgi:hypothetical protein